MHPNLLSVVMDYKDQENHFELSGPILTQPHKMDDLWHRNERHIRQVARSKSRFERGKKYTAKTSQLPNGLFTKLQAVR